MGKKWLFSLALLVSLFICPGWIARDEPIPEQAPNVVFSKTEISPGDFGVIYISPLRSGDKILIEGDVITEPPFFAAWQQGKAALLPLSYRTVPGKYPLHLSLERVGKTVWEWEKEVIVPPKEFTKQDLHVSAKLLAVRSPENQNKDNEYVAQAKAVSAEEPLWAGPFQMPLAGTTTTEFGQIRYLNGQESSRHSGLDIAAPRSTPVRATNSGIVRLSRRQNVTGNTIIIDHGFKLYSSYAHLDKLLVKEGDKVAGGQIIGLVGSTGFSTGSHLHWTLSIGSVFVNPYQLLREEPLSGLGL